MGTLFLPYQSKSHAQELFKRMQKPWMIQPETDGNANLLLKELFNDDSFLDELTDLIGDRKKSFDGRNFIKKFLKKIIEDEELGGQISSDFETWNLTRKAVGLKTLSQKQILNLKFTLTSKQQQQNYAVSLKEVLKMESLLQSPKSGIRNLSEVSQDIKKQVLKITGSQSREVFFFTELASYQAGFWAQDYLFMDRISASQSKDLYFAELSFMSSKVPKLDQSLLKNIFQAVPEIVRAAISPNFERRIAFLIDLEVDATKKSFWTVSAKEKIHIKKIHKRWNTLFGRRPVIMNRAAQIQREKDSLKTYFEKYPDTKIVIPTFVKRKNLTNNKAKSISASNSEAATKIKIKTREVSTLQNVKSSRKKSMKTDRPSPAKSATLFNPGTKKRGQDGNMYVIKESSNGVRRWVKFKPVG